MVPRGSSHHKRRLRFPRDDSGILSNRAVAPVGASTALAAAINDAPDWASTCARDGCRLTYSVDIARGIATDKRGDWGFEEKQRIVMAPLSRWLVRPEDRRARKLALEQVAALRAVERELALNRVGHTITASRGNR